MLYPEFVQLPETIGKRVDPTYSKKLQNRIKELLNWQHEGFPGSRPVEFESKHLRAIEREDYFVTEKAEGVRYLLYFLQSPKGPASFLYDRNQIWYYVPNLLFPLRGRENEYLGDTLMDGELVLDIDADRKTWRYLIFDLMIVNGTSILQRSFNSRLGMLQQDVIHPFNNSLKTISDANKLPPFTIELKKMERAYGLRVLLDQIPKLKHRSNGIIWIPVKYPYTPGKCNKLLKWKPPESISVNFRISAKWSKEHKPFYSIELLSNGGITYKFHDYFQPDAEIAAAWRNNLPDGRIGEFKYDAACEVTIIEQGYAPTVRKGGWRFVRFKDDKTKVIDETAIKQVLRTVHNGMPTEQILASMDRVRTAWKAREKGLRMPALPSNEAASSISQSTHQQVSQTAKSSTSTTTYPSSISDKPTITPSTFSINAALLNDSIDKSHLNDANSQVKGEILANKRKLSQKEMDIQTSSKKDKIEQPIDENSRKRTRISVNGQEQNPAADETSDVKRPLQMLPAKTQQVIPKEMESSSSSAPSSSRSTISQPKTIVAANGGQTENHSVQKIKPNLRPVTPSIPTIESSTVTIATGNRRSKSISELINSEPSGTSTSQTSPVDLPPKVKRYKPSSIHDLLAPSAARSSPEPHSGQSQSLSQQHQVPLKQAVQFINYHAEERQSTVNNSGKNVLIIRSEAHPEPPGQSISPHQHVPVQQNMHHSNTVNNDSPFRKFSYNDRSKKKTQYQDTRSKGSSEETESSNRVAKKHPQDHRPVAIEHPSYQYQQYAPITASPGTHSPVSQLQSNSPRYPSSYTGHQHHHPFSPTATMSNYQQSHRLHSSQMSSFQSSQRPTAVSSASLNQNTTPPQNYHRRQQRQNSEHLPTAQYNQDPSLNVHQYQQRLSLPPSLPQQTLTSAHQSHPSEGLQQLQHSQLHPQGEPYPVITTTPKRKDSQKAKLDFILN